MGDNRSYMQRAIALALKAEGHTSPNPLVGCMLVKDGCVISEGYHQGPGKDHAEVDALKKAGEKAKGATAFVTLEPCNHYGNTPPCTKALIDAEIAEVYFAVTDPNPLAEGGAHTLQKAGIKVHSGLLEEEARNLIRFWLHHQKTNRPYVIAKYAASLDGKIAAHTGDSKWITNEEARKKAHELRQACDAIIVGVETVIADNPSLTSRSEKYDTPAHPIRVVIDSTGRTPLQSNILSPDIAGKTIIAITDAVPEDRLKALQNSHCEVVVLPAHEQRVCLKSLLDILGQRGILSCMVEGGAQSLGSFFDQQLVQEVWAFIAPKFIGGDGTAPIAGRGVSKVADAHRLENTSVETLGSNWLIRGIVHTPIKEVSCSQD